MPLLRLLRAASLVLATLCSLPLAAQQSAVDLWETLLKPRHFAGIDIVEDHSVIDLATPYRSEDAAFTPVRIKALVPQTAARYIERIYLFVDANPEPLVGTFTFTPAAGSADLALRVRIERYTDVRAVAVLNTGEHHMVKRFVKAQGGCAIPLAIDYQQAMRDVGNIQLRTLTADDALGIPAQLRVRHPNFTGMQMDYKIYAVRPAHYVNTIRVLLDGTPVMSAETGIAVSADPSFRFFLKPGASGEITAEITDTKGNHWRESFTL